MTKQVRYTITDVYLAKVPRWGGRSVLRAKDGYIFLDLGHGLFAYRKADGKACVWPWDKVAEYDVAEVEFDMPVPVPGKSGVEKRTKQKGAKEAHTGFPSA